MTVKACLLVVALIWASGVGATLTSVFAGNGVRDFERCDSDFALQPLPVAKVQWTPALAQALAQQQQWLRIQASKGPLSPAQQLVAAWSLPEGTQWVDLTDLQAWLSPGESCHNSLVTGYVSSELRLQRQPDERFRYPIYALPASESLRRLGRTAIDVDQGLAGRGLELGYSDSLLDIFLLQVQGSGLVHFVDTDEQVTLGYAGKNGHRYRSIGRYLVEQGWIATENISVEAIRQLLAAQPELLLPTLLQNQSYVFFHEQLSAPRAANNTEAIEGATAAIDTQWYDHGSMLLVEVPILNEQRELVGRDFRLYLANDRGGAIKGPGRVDLYFGTDELRAGHLNHYSRVWRLSF